MNKLDLMAVAQIAALDSPMNTKVGAALVAYSGEQVTGHNKVPDYIDPNSYSEAQVEDMDQHAERSALNQAAKSGVRTNHSTIYVTHTPCPTCAGALIDAGVAEVIINEANHLKYQTRPKWESRWRVSEQMFRESKVRVEFI